MGFQDPNFHPAGAYGWLRKNGSGTHPVVVLCAAVRNLVRLISVTFLPLASWCHEILRCSRTRSKADKQIFQFRIWYFSFSLGSTTPSWFCIPSSGGGTLDFTLKEWSSYSPHVVSHSGNPLSDRYLTAFWQVMATLVRFEPNLYNQFQLSSLFMFFLAGVGPETEICECQRYPGYWKECREHAKQPVKQ